MQNQILPLMVTKPQSISNDVNEVDLCLQLVMMHQAAISGQCTMMMLKEEMGRSFNVKVIATMSQSQPLDSMSPMRKDIFNNIGNSLNFKYLKMYKF